MKTLYSFLSVLASMLVVLASYSDVSKASTDTHAISKTPGMSFQEPIIIIIPPDHPCAPCHTFNRRPKAPDEMKNKISGERRQFDFDRYSRYQSRDSTASHT